MNSSHSTSKGNLNVRRGVKPRHQGVKVYFPKEATQRTRREALGASERRRDPPLPVAAPTDSPRRFRFAMDFFQHRYYSRNKILLTFIGQWPYQSDLSRRGFNTLTYFLAACQVAPQLLAVVKYRDDWNVFLDCIPPLIFVTVSFAKFFSSMWNSGKMLRLLDRIRTDWQVWTPDPEVTILHEYAERGRRMTTMYAAAIYSSGILFITQPVVPKIVDVFLKNGSEPGEFPIIVDYYRLDPQKYYFYIIAYTYVCVSEGLLVTMALDTILIVCVQHGCGIFAALGHKLEQIGENERGSKSGQTAYALEKRDVDFENIATCVDRHNDAIEYADLLETSYSWCFLIIVGCDMLIISITGLQVFTRANDPQATVRFVCFAFAQMMHLYLKSYMSQILLDHSISIRYSIQNGRWYKLSLKSQKLLNMMVMRCNAPCKLTAGKITVMSVETFAMFLKMSMSYFTLLRSV